MQRGPGQEHRIDGLQRLRCKYRGAVLCRAGQLGRHVRVQAAQGVGIGLDAAAADGLSAAFARPGRFALGDQEA